MNYGDIENEANAFLKINTVAQLADFLETHEYALNFLIARPPYKTFTIPKPNGERRLIEEPHSVLKIILQKLNDAFQCVYYLNRSKAAYGFQWAVPHEKTPRNIVSNAAQHLKKTWLLNADFQDFFHQVSGERLFTLFTAEPFSFSERVASTLVSLCSYNNRLPMGSPISPVLSNWATRDLDTDLLDFATKKHLVYTRFVDDLSFSSNTVLTYDTCQQIFGISAAHGFTFNPDKIKLYKPTDEKIVTGIVVGDTLRVEKEYLDKLSSEIQKYAHTNEVNYRNGNLQTDYLKKFEQQIDGHLRFVASVTGKGNEAFTKLNRQFTEAKATTQFDTVNWLDFGYINLL